MEILLTTFGSNITTINALIRVAISILIGSIIGIERERKNRPAGLRTHVLVCMTASLIAMVEQQMIYEVNALNSAAINLSFGRLSVGVITGIGFIGAGTIMMSKSRIVGLTTAASLWCTACLGLINGMGFCLIAFIASILVIVVLEVLKIGETTSINRIIEVKFKDDNKTSTNIENEFINMKLKVVDSNFAYIKSEEGKICTARYSIVFKNNDEIHHTMSILSDIENVNEVKMQNVL